MSDNLNIINCPACHNKMTKIYIPELKINIDICLDGCGGIYFDNREMNRFDENKEDISHILETIKDKKFIEVDETETRVCPICGHNMVKHFSSDKHEIEIDECYSCGGIFLDNKELGKIRAEYETEEERDKAVRDDILAVIGPELKDLKEYRPSALKSVLDSIFTKFASM